MFRNGKFSEATPAKQSRSERFQEMSKQQQLIEQKKREIQARFEEKKKKTVELIEENKSRKPIAITKNAIKLDKIKSFYQKSKSIKKNEAFTKNIKEEFPYESTGAHKNKPNVKDVFEKEDVTDPRNIEKNTEPKAEHVVKLESNYCQEAYKEPKSFIPDHQFIGYINQSYQQPNYYNSPSVQVTSIQSQPQTTVVQVPTVSIVTTHPILQISQPTSMYQPQNPVFLSQNNSKINIPHGTYQQYPLQTPPLTATIVTDTTTTTTVPRNADEQPSLIVTETSTVSLGPTPDAAHLLNAPPQTIETYTPVPRALNTVMRCEPQAVLENQDVESLAATVAEYGDEIENIILQERPQDINLLFLRDKTSPAYTIFRQRVGYLKAKMIAHKLTPTDIKSQTLSNRVSVADSENDDVANKKRKRKSRWANDNVKVPVVSPIDVIQPVITGQTIPQPINDHKLVGIPGMSGPMISQIGRNDPALVQYAMQSFGTINLSEEDWKKAEDHYKINLLYQDMLKKRQQLENLHKAGKFKYEYDSDEDTEGGTWEHKLRKDEMVATERWAEELTEKSKDKHHIGDFLPPDELARFMEKYSALKEDREPDLSDYKEFKLKEDNIGFQMLQKLGWSEGQGLGSGGTGIVEPVNKGGSHNENHGLGVERPSELRQNDDEFDAYRKRMMLAYRFRPNPLNNPRRPYY